MHGGPIISPFGDWRELTCTHTLVYRLLVKRPRETTFSNLSYECEASKYARSQWPKENSVYKNLTLYLYIMWKGLIFLTQLLFNFIISTYLSHQVNLILHMYWILVPYICLSFLFYMKPREVMKYEMHFFLGWVCKNFLLKWFSLTSLGHVGRFYFSNLLGVGFFFGVVYQ